MKDTMDIKKALLQSLISSIKDAESEGIKNRPVSATVVAVKKPEGEECDMEEGSGEPEEEMDMEDPDVLEQLKKLFGA